MHDCSINKQLTLSANGDMLLITDIELNRTTGKMFTSPNYICRFPGDFNDFIS